jgi:hypothetical protein
LESRTYKGKELGSSPEIGTKSAEHHGSFHNRILFFHAPHHHAEMLGFDDHANTPGAGYGFDSIRYLLCRR